ncbi:hypothetical protein KNT87_gp125 [Erwinia phage Cronus]|uniref:Uncharacterized protein n=1 Tax=Erwinia phage Cronus TaxID=2163633 RepID=A0A2S1GMG2_9CAUD|nr:hypothetical protein KNT87_gp125 [Erwinia phage Cronus]AWD90564.1 hypothetical protein [Erwinia phage Cronus]
MHEDEEMNDTHIFYRTVSKTKGVAAVHKYLLKYNDVYLIVGTDSQFADPYGLMSAIEFKPEEIEPCEERQVKMWMDMCPLAFDLLTSCIYQRM